MEAACIRLNNGDLTCLPYILSYVQGTDTIPTGSTGRALYGALVGILVKEGPALRRGKQYSSTIERYSPPSEESCTSLTILSLIGWLQTQQGLEARGVILGYGLQSCREMSLDAYFALPKHQTYCVVNFVNLIILIFGCSVEDILFQSANIEASLLGTVEGSSTVVSRKPNNRRSSHLEDGIAVHGASRDLPTPLPGRRFRPLPSQPAVIPFAVNPLFDEHIGASNSALFPAQPPGPVIEFSKFFGLGCIPHIPSAEQLRAIKTCRYDASPKSDLETAVAGTRREESKASLTVQRIAESTTSTRVPGATLRRPSGMDDAHCLDSILFARYMESGKLLSWGENSYHALGDMKQLPALLEGKSTLSNFAMLPGLVTVPAPVLQTACGHLTSYIGTAKGELFSCGRADFGQLGMGDEGLKYQQQGALSFQRVALSGSDRAVAIFAGPLCAAALSEEKTIYCWGHNMYGQCIKRPTAERVLTPIRFKTGKFKPTQIQYGQYYGAIVFEDGVVGTWGHADMIGTRVDEKNLQPSLASDNSKCIRQVSNVPGLLKSKVVHVRTGPTHAILITECGEVLSWGSGADGQLGHGCDSDEISPRLVDALLPHIITDGACGTSHTAVIASTGVVYVFGSNQHGQLGRRGTQSVRSPRVLHLPGPVLSVSCGRENTCVLLVSGDVMVCGSLRTCGIGFGYGSRICAASRILQNYVTLSISCGTTHSLATAVSRTTAVTRVGHSSVKELSKMQSVMVRSGVRSVASGNGFVIILSENSNVVAMGRGEVGQLGVGDRMKPENADELRVLTKFGAVRLPEGVALQSVVCGPDYVLAIDSCASVYGWGSNRCSQLCQPLEVTAVYTPVRLDVYQDRTIVQIACAERFVVALTESGQVLTHGVSDYCGIHEVSSTNEQSGMSVPEGGGADTLETRPVLVTTLSNIVSVAAGAKHAVALDHDGVVFVWGRGVLGNVPVHSVVRIPVKVTLSHHVRKIGCGPWNTFIINTAGELFVWGSNRNGQCGVESPDDFALSDESDGPIVSTPTLVARHVRDAAFTEKFGVVSLEDGRICVAGRLRHHRQDYDLPTFRSQPQPFFAVDVNDTQSSTPARTPTRQPMDKSMMLVVAPALSLSMPSVATHLPDPQNTVPSPPDSPLLSPIREAAASITAEPNTQQSGGVRAAAEDKPKQDRAVGIQCFGGYELVYVVMEKHRPSTGDVTRAHRGMKLAFQKGL